MDPEQRAILSQPLTSINKFQVVCDVNIVLKELSRNLAQEQINILEAESRNKNRLLVNDFDIEK